MKFSNYTSVFWEVCFKIVYKCYEMFQLEYLQGRVVLMSYLSPQNLLLSWTRLQSFFLGFIKNSKNWFEVWTKDLYNSFSCSFALILQQTGKSIKTQISSIRILNIFCDFFCRRFVKQLQPRRRWSRRVAWERRSLLPTHHVNHHLFHAMRIRLHGSRSG